MGLSKISFRFIKWNAIEAYCYGGQKRLSYTFVIPPGENRTDIFYLEKPPGYEYQYKSDAVVIILGKYNRKVFYGGILMDEISKKI